MNGNDKLFSFLLIDPKILEDETIFEKYKTSKEYEMYLGLVDRYSRCLEYLKIYRKKREEQIAYVKKVILDKQLKIKEYQKEINDIKTKFDISDDIIKHYVRNYTVEKTKMDSILISAVENDESMIIAFQQINVMGVNIMLLEKQISLLQEECNNYNYSYEMLSIIEKTFYNSYGFHARMINGKWVSEQQRFLDEFELRFQLEWKLAQDRKSKETCKEDCDFLLNEADDTEDVQIDGVDVEKVFGLYDQSVYESTETELWSDVDSLIIEWYDTLKAYATKSDMKKYEEKSKLFGSVDKHYNSEKMLADLRKHIEQTEKEERYEDIIDLLYAEKNSDYRQSYYEAVVELYKSLVSAKESLYSKYLVGDKDYRDLVVDIERLKRALDAYDNNRNAKQGAYNSTKERIADKSKRAIKLENQKNAMREIMGIILRIESNTKRKSAKTIAKKLYSIEEERDQLKKQGYDIDPHLYKQLFKQLKADVKCADAEFIKQCVCLKSLDREAKKVDISEYIVQNMDLFTITPSKFKHYLKRKNNMYTCGDLGIVTLNFYNTDMKEYKTALLIVDEDCLGDIIIHSSRLSWSFKNGKRASTQIYGKEKKTYTADIVTADKGRTNICNKIMGQAEREGVRYVTNSHKFDLRCKKLHSVAVRSRKQKFNEELYYQGKLRIEKEGELIADNTVCLNGKRNEKGASILYFNETVSFLEFLNELNS